MEDFILGVRLEAWEGAALKAEWVWSSDQISFPPVTPLKTPSKPNSSQFFAPKLTDPGDPVLSDRFVLHSPDSVTLFCAVALHKKIIIFVYFFFFTGF